MQAIVIVAWAAAAWWALALVVRVFMVAATFVQPLARRRAAVRGDHPPVSIVIPIARMEPEMEAALTSVFAQDHPGLEVLISAAERESAVIDLARRVADRFPDVAVRFMLGNERRTLNPKVSNLAPAIEAASNDLVLVVDSNITLRDGQLAALVRNLTPGIGMVCAITIGVKPKGFPAEIGCAMTNAHAAPAMMAGALFGGDIGFGKVMLFDRRHYRAVDGPRVMGSSFGDDVALAKALGRAGLRTVLAGEVIRQTIGARTLGEVWDRQLRWMIIRRDESPLAFKVEPFFTAGSATLAAALAAPVLGIAGWVLAGATLALWLASDLLVVAAHGWGWSWRYPAAALCRDLMIAGLWLRTWSSHEVTWAGRRFDVRGGPLRWTETQNGEIPPELPLWPEAPPVGRAEIVAERGTHRPDRSLRNVSVATLTAFLPPSDRATGAAVIVCPGGGYSAISIDKEGYDVARWLSTEGIAGLVLKYRLPRVGRTEEASPWPLEDIVRAIDLTSERAAAWGIDPLRIGAMGFSAGGHMAAHTANVDRRLGFAVLVYPVISMERGLAHKGSRASLLGARPSASIVERYSCDHGVTGDTAPTLIVHARDDDVVKFMNAERHAAALHRAGVPHESLFYGRGGHGFGLSASPGEIAEWPSRCIVWLRAQGMLNTTATAPAAPPNARISRWEK